MSFTLSASTAAAFDIAVGSIHVTQSTQPFDQPSWSPLVADRSTAVRVYVQCVSGTPGRVTGRLRVFVDGHEVTPAGGLGDLNSQVASIGQLTPDCYANPPSPAPNGQDVTNREQLMLNFELPAPSGIVPAAGQVESADVDFVVELSAAGDTNAANDVGRIDNLTVKRRAVPHLFKIPITYNPPGGPRGTPSPNQAFITPGVGDVMAPAVWPVKDVDRPGQGDHWTNRLFPPLLAPYTYGVDCGDNDRYINARGSGPPPSYLFPCDDLSILPPLVHWAAAGDPNFSRDLVSEPYVLLAHLLALRFMLVENGLGPTPLLFLYGYVASGNLFGHGGIALRGGGNVAYGSDDTEFGQAAFAHELGHTAFELDHNVSDRFVDDDGWDVGARLQNNPNPMNQNAASGRLKANSFGMPELMNGDSSAPTAETWVDPTNYQAALQHERFAVETTGVCEQVRCRDFETLLVLGIPAVDSEGRAQVGTSVMRYPWYTPPAVDAERPNLMVTLTVQEPGNSLTRTIRTAIDARAILESYDGKDEELGMAPFAAPIPVLKGATIRALRIEDVSGELLTGDLKPSAATPIVSIVSPRAGDPLSAKTSLAWVGSDKDAETKLSYQVAYSPNGRDFFPVAVGLDKTSLTVDGTKLPRTEGSSGLLRVFVNDGINTSYADVSVRNE